MTDQIDLDHVPIDIARWESWYTIHCIHLKGMIEWYWYATWVGM